MIQTPPTCTSAGCQCGAHWIDVETEMPYCDEHATPHSILVAVYAAFDMWITPTVPDYTNENWS